MPVTITKQKPAKATTQVSVDTAALVDAYATRKIELDGKMAKLAALVKEVKAAEEALLAYVDTVTKDDAEAVLRSAQYIVSVGAKGRKVTAMDKAIIKRELKRELFDQLADFSVEDLKKYLPQNVLDKALTYEHANKRRTTIKRADQPAG